MQNKKDIASGLFGNFNCSTSVFTAFCEDYGLDLDTARRMAGGLGGGCHAGEVCGAVSGAVLVIGLKYGQDQAGDNDTRTLCYEKTDAFIKAFLEKNPALTCRDLLDVDITTPEGNVLKMQKRHICVNAVESAAEILEDQGY
ncbi:MAG: C-GCAxxG-C-C family protein [Oscillospiraceae bacterium]|nr:C-GCAxxG-C-C family protein [Oscillospiraceae bacterium]